MNTLCHISHVSSISSNTQVRRHTDQQGLEQPESSEWKDINKEAEKAEHQDYLLKIIEIIISVFRRLRQENHELKSSLGCSKTLNGKKQKR